MLTELSGSVEDPKTESEAESLITHMEEFSFLTCLIACYDLLFQVLNFVSNTLQAKLTELTSVKSLLDNCKAFFASFRVKGLLSSVVSVIGISVDTEIKQVFPKKPLRNKRSTFRAKGLKSSNCMIKTTSVLICGLL